MRISADDPVPFLTGRLSRPGGSTQLRARSAWDFAELVREALAIVPASASAPDDSVKIDLVGSFTGPPPSAELSRDMVVRLAETNVTLSISLEPSWRQRLSNDSRAPSETESKLFFSVSGHFDPNAFTQTVGVSPTSVVREGEPRLLIPRVSVWSLKRGPFTGHEIPVDAIEALLGELVPRAAVIRSATNDANVTSSFGVFIDLADVAPTFRLSSRHFVGLARLGSSVEYSVSILRESSAVLEF